MNKIEAIKFRTKTTVEIDLSDTMTLNASYVDRRILPDKLILTYRYVQTTPTVGQWVCSNAEVHGHRVLKPARDGSLRTGQDRHKAFWYTYNSVKDLDVFLRSRPNDCQLPGWLADMIDNMRPTGNVVILPAV